MRSVRGMRIVSILAVGGLAAGLAACGDAPESSSGTGSSAAPAAGTYKTCMVTDIGGIDDRSFNASAWKGLTEAKADSDKLAEPKNVSSKAEADYVPNLTQFAQQGCNFNLAVGGLMTDATKQVAAANADKQFAIVDSAIPGATNVYPMQFDTAQAAFLAGYLSAGYSKSKKVATYGGLKIPPVTIFMDGFADGVAYWNTQKNDKVQVLGWDKATQNGSFAESFTDQGKGKALSDGFVAQGADVIMPVAGGTGLGTAANAADKYAVVWVDVDGCESAQQYCKAFLTTVVKNIPEAVKEAAVKGADSTGMLTGSYLGTLENDGVSIAPYHEFDSKVSAELKGEVDKLKADIIAGTVKVTSPAQPK
ncbi:BMP family ABC transporter substrate-binding protein [Asanoa siamensis]|uniref:BMP family ABC transporter substrate-binding protein n=2 Tax=Asanoa siamensis TaxID=926357 RepID=A0ABQ4CGV3_9ACTN|nr:BMP family ABC transporter substrate-binding protein [Asanoa siamensis]